MFFEEWFASGASELDEKKMVVYELYGLTDEEIAIVEAAVGD